jgi:hypothetical protein
MIIATILNNNNDRTDDDEHIDSNSNSNRNKVQKIQKMIPTTVIPHKKQKQ